MYQPVTKSAKHKLLIPVTVFGFRKYYATCINQLNHGSLYNTIRDLQALRVSSPHALFCTKITRLHLYMLYPVLHLGP